MLLDRPRRTLGPTDLDPLRLEAAMRGGPLVPVVGATGGAPDAGGETPPVAINFQNLLGTVDPAGTVPSPRVAAPPGVPPPGSDLIDAVMRLHEARGEAARKQAANERRFLEGLSMGVLADIAPNLLGAFAGTAPMPDSGAGQRAFDQLGNMRSAENLADELEITGPAEAAVQAAQIRQGLEATAYERGKDDFYMNLAGTQDRRAAEMHSLEVEMQREAQPVRRMELEQAFGDLQRRQARIDAATAAGRDPGTAELYYAMGNGAYEVYMDAKHGDGRAAQAATQAYLRHINRPYVTGGGRSGRAARLVPVAAIRASVGLLDNQRRRMNQQERRLNDIYARGQVPAANELTIMNNLITDYEDTLKGLSEYAMNGQLDEEGMALYQSAVMAAQPATVEDVRDAAALLAEGAITEDEYREVFFRHTGTYPARGGARNPSE